MQGKIGILGFGVVGKSVLRFLKNLDNNISIGIWDQRTLQKSELELVVDYRATSFDSSKTVLKSFFDMHDYIVISPGVNLENLTAGWWNKSYQNKCVCELDIFAKHFKKTTIAVTGTLGKTTITTLLGQQVENKKKQSVAIGGNVGIPMLSLIKDQQQFDMAVLELSSFQLEFSTKFAPDIAILTNLYSNHLDRHITAENYLKAKLKIFEYQNNDQHALMHVSCLHYHAGLIKGVLTSVESNLSFLSENLEYAIDSIGGIGIKNYTIFYKQDGCFWCVKIKNSQIAYQQKIFNLALLPDVGFEQNWLFVLATRFLLNLDLTLLKQGGFQETAMNEHRMELFVTINQVDFYNDSKATVIQATQAALEKLEQNDRPIILILGGLNKGVDRKPLLQYLNQVKKLKKVLCLGNQIKDFNSFEKYSSIKDIVSATMQIAKPGDQVLFSPSGSSFDLFDNYKHRGRMFKELVLELLC